MILIDKPYVSDYLKQTVIKNNFPVIDTPQARELLDSEDVNYISDSEAAASYVSQSNPLVYTNSENSIAWVEKHLSHTDLPKQLKQFKNKADFRELLSPMYPDYFFKRIHADRLQSLVAEEIEYPVIIKPAVGFFSMGVRRIDNAEELPAVVEEVRAEMTNANDLYPKEVIDNTEFIIEELAEGEEFAVDFYFDKEGRPVILNITQHLFSSGKDMSDRAYITSKKIIEENLEPFGEFLNEMSHYTKVNNFPAHIELRKDEAGRIVPIEVNPLRFGGWCSTGDLAQHFLGVNIYEFFFEQKTPDWSKILSSKAGKIYSLFILENSTGHKAQEIQSFDYDLLQSIFKTPLELRKINYSQYPIFAFLFTETDDSETEEIDNILKSKLTEFIRLK
ncbi:MAG: ATP-grasp domain-containing protein [Bacteroidota bacterium]|nr:ATP-grasp domain-containing protein [Bacteroidota bacterium]